MAKDLRFTFFTYLGGGSAVDYFSDDAGQIQNRPNLSGMGFFENRSALFKIPFEKNQPEYCYATYIERKSDGETVYAVIFNPGENDDRMHLPHTFEIVLPRGIRITNPDAFVGAIEKVADKFYQALSDNGLVSTRLRASNINLAFVQNELAECVATVRSSTASVQTSPPVSPNRLQPFVLKGEPTNKVERKQALLRGSADMVRQFAQGEFAGGVLSTCKIFRQMRQQGCYGFRDNALPVKEIALETPAPAVTFVDASLQVASGPQPPDKIIAGGDNMLATAPIIAETARPHPAMKALLDTAGQLLTTLSDLAATDPVAANGLAELLRKFRDPEAPTAKPPETPLSGGPKV